MRKIAFLITASVMAALTYSQTSNRDVPLISTGLSYGDGAKITLQYKAIHWDPTQTQGKPNPNFSSNMGILDTNIKLRLGSQAIDPGTYHVGFQIQPQENDPEKLRGVLLLSDNQQERVRLPLFIQKEQNMITYLSMLFSPGITDRDFYFSVLFGTYSATMRWTITGIPSKTISPINGSHNTGKTTPVSAQISPATGSVQSSPPSGPNATLSHKRVGSGSFRYLQQKKRKKESE